MLHGARLPRLFFRCAHTPSAGLRSGSGRRSATAARPPFPDSLSEDQQAAVNRPPDSDPAVALGVNALLARAHQSGAGLHAGATT